MWWRLDGQLLELVPLNLRDLAVDVIRIETPPTDRVDGCTSDGQQLPIGESAHRASAADLRLGGGEKSGRGRWHFIVPFVGNKKNRRPGAPGWNLAGGRKAARCS